MRRSVQRNTWVGTGEYSEFGANVITPTFVLISQSKYTAEAIAGPKWVRATPIASTSAPHPDLGRRSKGPLAPRLPSAMPPTPKRAQIPQPHENTPHPE